MAANGRQDPRVVANCLDKCIHQDVCYGCAYLDVPNGEYGECINEMMDDACMLLRTQRYRIYQVEKLHAKLKRSNLELRAELKQLREELSRYRKEEHGLQRNESDRED